MSRQSLPAPYYADDFVTLYNGRAEDILPALADVAVDVVVTDPPYGQTALTWDRWVDHWPSLIPAHVPQMWCFGTFRMFMDHAPEFRDWRFGQDVIWEKHNGSGPGDGRFLRVHETIAHFYRGKWGELHYETPRENVYTQDKSARRPANAVAQRRPDRQTAYADDGTRLVRSVVKCPSVRYQRRNETEKPPKVVETVIAASTAPGGLVLDLFSGSGAVLEAARNLGRRSVGIELREEQCFITSQRLAQGVLSA